MTPEDRRRLTVEYLPLAVYLAMRWHAVCPQVPTEEFVQEAMLEVWRRAARYDSARGASFLTWAAIAARSAMGSFVRDRWTQPSRAAQEAYRRIRGATAALACRTGRPPGDYADYEIADELGLGMEEYHALARRASVPSMVSLNSLTYGDSGDSAFEPTDPYPPAVAARVEQWEIIERLLRSLTPRQRLIVEMHYFNKFGLRRGIVVGFAWGRAAVRIGERLGISEGLVFLELREALQRMRLYADAVGITADG